MNVTTIRQPSTTLRLLGRGYSKSCVFDESNSLDSGFYRKPIMLVPSKSLNRLISPLLRRLLGIGLVHTGMLSGTSKSCGSCLLGPSLG